MKSISTSEQPAISPPYILGFMICLFSGSSFHDISDRYFLWPIIFHLLSKGFCTLLTSKETQTKLLTMRKDLEALQVGFRDKSANEVMSRCVGALDGSLLLICNHTRQ